MVKKIIDEKQRNSRKSLFMKIGSLLASICLWFYVVYSENPVREVWVRNIPVTYKNIDVLKDNSLIIVGENQKSVSVKVNGRRRDVLMLKNSNVNASVDFSSIKESGQYNLPISFSFPIDSVDVTDKNPYNITVTVDKLAKTTREIIVNYIGTPKEGCSYEKAILSSASVTLSGPASFLPSVKSVSVSVDITDASENIEITATPELTFAEGFEENASYIVCDVSSVKVTVPIGISKTVPVVSNSHLPITIDPQNVQITGQSEQIAEIQNISLAPFEFLEGETTKDVALILPEGIACETSSVKVTLSPESENPPEEEPLE